MIDLDREADDVDWDTFWLTLFFWRGGGGIKSASSSSPPEPKQQRQEYKVWTDSYDSWI